MAKIPRTQEEDPNDLTEQLPVGQEEYVAPSGSEEDRNALGQQIQAEEEVFSGPRRGGKSSPIQPPAVRDLMEDLRTREPEPEPEIWYEDGIPNIRVRPQGVAPKPAKVAQAKTGTTTDASDPLEMLRRLSQGERLDDDYAKTLQRREQDGANKWFSDLAEQMGTPLVPEQPVAEPQGSLASQALDKARTLKQGNIVYKNIGGVVTDSLQWAVGGPLRGLAALLDQVDQAAVWLNKNVADTRLPGGGPGSRVPIEEYSGENLKELVPDPYGARTKPPETGVGAVLQAITQFLTGYAVAGRATGIGNSAGGALTKSFMSDFGAFQGNEGNFADLLLLAADYAPTVAGVDTKQALRNSLTEYLADKTNSSDVEGRLKNAISGIVPSVLMPAAIGVLRSIREVRRAKELTGATTHEEAADKLANGGLAPGEGAAAPMGSKIEQLLGNPSDPLVSQIEGQLRPIDYGVDDGTAAKSLANAQGAHGAPSGFSNDVKINFARIDSPDDAKAVMGAVADAQAADIDAVRRGVRTNAETTKAAGDENSWEALFGQRKGDIPKAEMQLAMRKVWAASGQKLMEVAQAARVGGLEEMFAFRRMLAIHNTIQQVVIGARTETARALQQWRIPAGGNLEIERQLQSLLENSGGGENVTRNLARKIAELAEHPEWPGALDKMVRKSVLAKTNDVIREFWINAILSGIKTQAVNIMGNASVVAHAIGERAAAGRLGDVLHPVEGVKVGEAMAMWQGIRESMKDALVYAARTARTGETGHWDASNQGQGGMDAGKFVLEGPRTRAISSEHLELGDGMLGKGVDMLGSLVNLPGRGLATADEFFKTINYRAELYAQSFRQASEEIERGLLPREELKSRIADLLEDPPENLRMKAHDFALYNTFNSESSGVGQLATRIRDRIPFGYMAVPFVRTPENILKYTFERTPLAPVVARHRQDIAAGGARRDLAMAKLGLGTIMSSVFLDLAMDGHITGSGPDDPRARALLRRSGVQPWSIRFRTGEEKNGKPVHRYVAFNRFDPLGLHMGAMAEIGEYLRNTDNPRVDPEVGEAFSASVLSVTSALLDKAYMRGAAELVDAIRNPEQKGEAYFNRLASSFVPTIVKDMSQVADPVARQTWNMVSALKARTPLSNDLPARKDFWGKEISYSSGLGTVYDTVSPFYTSSTEKAEPIDREFRRLHYAPMHPGFMRLENKSISLRNMPLAKNRMIDLTTATTASQLLKDNRKNLLTPKGKKSAEISHLEKYGDKTAREYLTGLIKGEEGQASLDYQAAKPDQKKKMLTDVLKHYRAAAKIQVIREFPRIKELEAEIPERGYDDEDLF
jgi:hypothetical protein